MPEKKETIQRYFVSKKDHTEPRVLKAKSEKDAIEQWRKQTGEKAADAEARPIGSRAETILRDELEKKPRSRPSEPEPEDNKK